eukprot:1147635-Pelagomonas_calceolata.AAC.3
MLSSQVCPLAPSLFACFVTFTVPAKEESPVRATEQKEGTEKLPEQENEGKEALLKACQR